MIINIIIIIFIMIFVKKYKIYRICLFVSLHLYNNIKQIIIWCKILELITINIFNMLY
jgi:hypothetical protein